MKNLKIIIFFIAILGLLLFSIYLFLQKTNSLSSPAQIEKCNTLQKNYGDINILFFSSKSIAEEYSNYFLNSKPFNKNKNNFNFFYIDDIFPKCELYNGEAFYCYSKDLIKKSASCPSDYIVVIDSYPREVRSSAFMNVMSLNSNHDKSVMLHEFGHVFAGLAEEYEDVDAKIPKEARNCVDDCLKFNSVGGCYIGCTKSTYYRSSWESVMRSLNTPEFYSLNNQIIEERIQEEKGEKTIITGNVIENTDCSGEEYYLIELVDGVMTKTLYRGCAGSMGFGDTEYKVYSKDRNLILERKFNKDLIFTTLPAEDGKISGATYEYEGDIYLKVPIMQDENLNEIKEISEEFSKESGLIEKEIPSKENIITKGIIYYKTITDILISGKSKETIGGISPYEDFSSKGTYTKSKDWLFQLMSPVQSWVYQIQPTGRVVEDKTDYAIEEDVIKIYL